MHSLRRLLLANVEVPYQQGGRSPIVTDAILVLLIMMVAFLIVSLVPKAKAAQKLKLLLAHHPQLRHVHMEVVHPPISMAAICVRLARIKTEVV